MIDHNHFICHFIFGGHLLNIPNYKKYFYFRDVGKNCNMFLGMKNENLTQ